MPIHTALLVGLIILYALLATVFIVVHLKIQKDRAAQIAKQAASKLEIAESEDRNRRASLRLSDINRCVTRAKNDRKNLRNPGGNSKQRRTLRRKAEREEAKRNEQPFGGALSE